MSLNSNFLQKLLKNEAWKVNILELLRNQVSSSQVHILVTRSIFKNYNRLHESFSWLNSYRLMNHLLCHCVPGTGVRLSNSKNTPKNTYFCCGKAHTSNLYPCCGAKAYDSPAAVTLLEIPWSWLGSWLITDSRTPILWARLGRSSEDGHGSANKSGYKKVNYATKLL